MYTSEILMMLAVQKKKIFHHIQTSEKLKRCHRCNLLNQWKWLCLLKKGDRNRIFRHYGTIGTRQGRIMEFHDVYPDVWNTIYQAVIMFMVEFCRIFRTVQTLLWQVGGPIQL